MKLGWLVLIGALLGCAPRLSPREEAVRVVDDQALVAGCDVGPVLGEERRIGGLLLAGQAEANALQQLRRETAQLGGNTVVLARTDTGMAGSQILGEAYRCG